MKPCFLPIFALLSIGCANRMPQPQHDDAVFVPAKSFMWEVADPTLWYDMSHGDKEFFWYIDSARLDWTQVVNHYLSIKHPHAKQLILTWGKNQRFDMTQKPRLNDIHYIDTLLSLCYYCTTGQLASPFNRELEKYLSLPITFQQPLPLFERSQMNIKVDSLLNIATDGIRIFYTPDKKYKIYSCEDRFGTSGRFYSVYLQYIKDGQVTWKQIPDWGRGKYSNQQIDKIYSLFLNGQTYYVLISHMESCSYFEIISIENGEFIPHPKFYPKHLQNNINDGSLEFYGGLDSYVDLDFNPQTLTISYTYNYYRDMSEKQGQLSPNYKMGEEKIAKLNLE